MTKKGFALECMIYGGDIYAMSESCRLRLENPYITSRQKVFCKKSHKINLKTYE